MRALAITSSTAHASIALGDGQHFWQKTHDIPRGHTEFMNVALDELIKESGWTLQDLDVIAVDRGPGSFTGIRVAVNVARSLAYMLKKPIYQTESLDLLCPRENGFIVTALNAYKNLVFCTIFENGIRKEDSKVLSPSELEAWVNQACPGPVTVIGDGWTVYAQDWSESFRTKVLRNSAFSDTPFASTLLDRALANSSSWIQDWNLVSPLYLRESSAEEALYGSKNLGRRIR